MRFAFSLPNGDRIIEVVRTSPEVDRHRVSVDLIEDDMYYFDLHCSFIVYRVVQLDLTPDIEVLYLLFDSGLVVDRLSVKPIIGLIGTLLAISVSADITS